jgi:hypothetical protein
MDAVNLCECYFLGIECLRYATADLKQPAKSFFWAERNPLNGVGLICSTGRYSAAFCTCGCRRRLSERNR